MYEVMTIVITSMTVFCDIYIHKDTFLLLNTHAREGDQCETECQLLQQSPSCLTLCVSHTTPDPTADRHNRLKGLKIVFSS